jgi:hypothetical protein
MPNCDNCGLKTERPADNAGIILCEDCSEGRYPSTEKIIAELEAEGIDVRAFLRRVHATVSKYSSNDRCEQTGKAVN